jgi:hypothetical protein
MMRTKQPKVLFPTRKEKRPHQEIPTEAARIKARLARLPSKTGVQTEPVSTVADPKPRT